MCAAALAMAAPRASGQTVEGSVIERATGEPLAGTSITALLGDSAVAATLSGPEGRFRLTLPEGTFTVRAERIGYESDETIVTISGTARWSVVLELASAPVELDTIQATVESRVYEPDGVMQRRSQIAAGEQLARLEAAGYNTLAVLHRMSGLRFVGNERMPCIESTRRRLSMSGGPSGCNMVVIIVNGVTAGPEVLSQPLWAFESIEYLPPADAGMRYGMQAGTRGALVLWRRGSGPRRSADRDAGPPDQSPTDSSPRRR